MAGERTNLVWGHPEVLKRDLDQYPTVLGKMGGITSQEAKYPIAVGHELASRPNDYPVSIIVDLDDPRVVARARERSSTLDFPAQGQIRR